MAAPLPRPTPVQLVCLTIITVVAIAFRIYHLTIPSLWFDEDVSVVVATGHWESVFFSPTGYFEKAPDIASPHSLRPLYTLFGEAESHPPFYSFVLRAWWSIFGMSDQSGRMLSVLLSTLAVLVVFDIGRLIGDGTTGLWAAAMLAVSPLQIRYAQELRDYALLILLGAAACDAMLRIYRIGPTRWRWFALGLFAVLATETHYLIIGAIAGLGVFSFMKLREKSRWIGIGIVAFALLSLIAIRLPVIAAHWNVTQAEADPLGDSRAGLIGRTVLRTASMPMWLILSPRNEAKWTGSAAILLLILPFFLDRKRPGLLLLGLWSCGVIGFVAASDVILGHKSLLNVRYSLAATPAIMVIIAVLADLGGRLLRHTLPILVILGAVLAIPSVYFDEVWEKTEARLWADDISKNIRPGDVLVVASSPGNGLYRATLEYLQLAHYAYPIPCPIAIVEGPASEAVRETVWAHPRVWVAICHYYIDPSDALGPCRVVQDGKDRYFAGRLVRVERIVEPPATPSVTGAIH